MVGAFDAGAITFEADKGIAFLAHHCLGHLGLGHLAFGGGEHLFEDGVFDAAGAFEAPACADHVDDQKFLMSGGGREIQFVAVEEGVELGGVLVGKDGAAGG
jgi:hypothetical protein